MRHSFLHSTNEDVRMFLLYNTVPTYNTHQSPRVSTRVQRLRMCTFSQLRTCSQMLYTYCICICSIKNTIWEPNVLFCVVYIYVSIYIYTYVWMSIAILKVVLYVHMHLCIHVYIDAWKIEMFIYMRHSFLQSINEDVRMFLLYNYSAYLQHSPILESFNHQYLIAMGAMTCHLLCIRDQVLKYFHSRSSLM